MSKKIISMLLTLTLSVVCMSSIFETKAYARDNRISTESFGSNTVNIKMDRYKLRGADGKVYYHIYGTYYNLDGSYITSELVQQGVM